MRLVLVLHGDSSDMTCPLCDLTFKSGYRVQADQKLYSHMSKGKAHRRKRKKMDWDKRHWLKF